MNCIAIALLDNTILYKEFMNIVDPDRDHKPYIDYLYILGCKAYILIPPEDRLKSRKLDPCTEIVILVGYKGEYIYQIQVPGSGGSRGRIVRSSYIRFDKRGLITDSTLSDFDILIPDKDRGDQDDISNSDQSNQLNKATTDYYKDHSDYQEDCTDYYKVEFQLDELYIPGLDNEFDLLREVVPPRPIEEEEEFFNIDDIDDPESEPEP